MKKKTKIKLNWRWKKVHISFAMRDKKSVSNGQARKANSSILSTIRISKYYAKKIILGSDCPWVMVKFFSVVAKIVSKKRRKVIFAFLIPMVIYEANIDMILTKNHSIQIVNRPTSYSVILIFTFTTGWRKCSSSCWPVTCPLCECGFAFIIFMMYYYHHE